MRRKIRGGYQQNRMMAGTGRTHTDFGEQPFHPLGCTRRKGRGRYAPARAAAPYGAAGATVLTRSQFLATWSAASTSAKSLLPRPQSTLSK